MRRKFFFFYKGLANSLITTKQWVEGLEEEEEEEEKEEEEEEEDEDEEEEEEEEEQTK